MIAEALKKAILQAAIQGKLTEQLPEDGDARDLLKEIQREKARLIKEGKIKKEKPLPEINEDEIPFDIPENWIWARLSSVGEIIGGGTPRTDEKKNWLNGDIPWITPADMKNQQGKYVKSGSRFITNFGLSHSSSQLLQKGTVLFSSRAPIGYVAIADNELCTNQGFKSITPFCFGMSEYIYYYLLASSGDIEKIGSGTTFKEVSGSVMKQVIIPVPPLAEQKRIVEKLESLLPEIETLKTEENKLDNLEKAFPGKIRASILQAAIQGKLTEQLPEDGDARDLLKEIQKEKARLIKEGKIKKQKPLPEITEDEIPFDIPENWVWVRLGDYIDFKIGKTPSRGESSYWGNDLPWVSISDMNNQPVIKNTKEKISNKAFSEVFNGKIVPKGTLLMSFKLTIGRISFLGIDALHNEAIISINPIIKNPIIDGYLFKVLPFFAQTGETKGAIKGQTLNSSSIRRLLFPLAPLAEQERIIQKLDELLPLCTSLETTSF